MKKAWMLRLLLGLVLALAAGGSTTNRIDEGSAVMMPGIPPSLGMRTGPSPLRGCERDPAGLPPVTRPTGGAANYLHTCGSRLYDAQGHQFRIAGLNWSGMETGNYVPGGLGQRGWEDILDQVAALGYNTIRLPFTNEALEPGRQVSGVSFELNPDLENQRALELLDLLIAGARQRGLKVILDRHRPTPWSQQPLWYSPEVPEDRWIADWRTLAARYRGDDAVVGVDLSNEPRSPASWGTGVLATDWRLAAERAGNAILQVNPYLLIFVEGIEDYQGDHSWWGGNLEGVRYAPVRLRVPDRVVYSPHDYGPEIADQVWFHSGSFPANLPQEWDRQWGYIARQGIAPVVVGEFGGTSVGADAEGRWQTALLSYLRVHDLGAIVWSLNPGGDTGGILADDWYSVNAQKQQAYQQILTQAPSADAGSVSMRATH